MKQVSKILGSMLMIMVIFGVSIVQAQTPTIINEIRIDQPSSDNDEYFELVGTPSDSLNGLTYLVIGDGSDGSSGVIEAVVNLSGEAIPGSGYFVTAESTFTMGTPNLTASLNFENSDNVTHLLVSGFTGANGDDLDSNDDGVLDTVPWSTLVDCVALIETVGSGDQTYCSTTVGPDGSFVPGHAFRCDDGWRIGSYNPSGGDDTPGTANPCGTDDPPTVSSTSPADSATNVAIDADIAINFSEDVTVTGTWFSINCASSGAHTAAVSGAPQNYTLNPDTDFGADELCTVTIYAAQVADQDGTADTMAADYAFSFTTSTPSACGNPATFIHDIQGNGMSSPEVGNVHTIEGVVVGDFQTSAHLRGFFVQEEDADADANSSTSEGIFIYDGSSPSVDVNVGDVVRVEGEVQEYYGLTRLGYIASVEICPAGGVASAATVTLPVATVNDWEWYEGMLINIPQTLYATGNYTQGRYGEVDLSVNARLVTPTNVVEPGAPANALQDSNDRSRIQLEDGRTSSNPVPVPYIGAGGTLRAGDTIPGLTGVLNYGFGAYEVHPTGAVNFTRVNTREATPPDVGGTLKVASFNVLNYFTTLDDSGPICGPLSDQDCRGADNADEFTRQRDKIISAIVAMDADVIGLMEMENHPTDAALQDLVNGLNDVAGSGTYAYVNTGPVGDDVIKVALIYKTAVVGEAGTAAILDTPTGLFQGEATSRAILAQTFEVVDNSNPSFGEKLTVAVNHFKSKSPSILEDAPACASPPSDPNCDQEDGQGYWNQRRTATANALTAWLAGDPTGSGDPDFLIIGDLNAYAMEDPITAIKSAGYTNLIEAFVGPDAYSYVYYGQAGYLDHALATSTLTAQVTGVTEWHINTDEPAALDYNNYNQPAGLYNPDPYRASDHDPVIVGLTLPSLEATKSVDGEDHIPGTDMLEVLPGDIFTYTIEFENPFEQAVFLTVTDALDNYLQYDEGSFAYGDEYFATGDLDYGILLNAGVPLSLSFDVAVLDSAPIGYEIFNTAWITASYNGTVIAEIATNLTKVEVVPEPRTLFFLGAGLLGIVMLVRRHRKQGRQ